MTLDWTRIQSGETFQDLVNALLAHEDKLARPYNRPGKDGGQDAKSGDGITVYQAKFHDIPTDAKVIADAKKEAKSIGKHKASGSNTAARWAGVQRWVMVTNAEGSPALDVRWNSEVRSLFTTLGLDATLWTTAKLEALLADQPGVRQQFFDGATKVFATLAEYEGAIQRRAPSLFVPWGAATFRARAAELAKVTDFVRGSKRVLLVHGPGGVGKSRFAIEAAYSAVKAGLVGGVRVALNDSMGASTNWYESIVAESNTLLIVDEPSDPALIRRLLDEVTAGRAQRWHVLVTARSPKQDIAEPLSTASKVVEEPLALGVLNSTETRSVAEELLQAALPDDHGLDIARTAGVVADFCEGFPVWIDAAVGLIAQGKDLDAILKSKDLTALWRRYVDEALTTGDAAARLVLRWIALLQPTARSSLYSMLGNHAKTTESVAEPIVDRLVASGLVRSFGIEKRMVSVVPDVFRDLTLRDWLGRGAGQQGPSAEGREVARSIVEVLRRSKLPQHTEEAKALHALGRIEVFAELPNLVSSAVDVMAEEIRKTATAVELRGAAEMAFTLAPFRVADFVRLSGLMRAQQVTDSVEEGLFKERNVTRTDVLRSVAWPLFTAGGRARNEDDFAAVAEELRCIYEAVSAANVQFRNDGKDPAQLWGRLLAETHTEAAFRVVEREVQAALRRLEGGQPERLGDDSLIALALSRRRSLFESDGKSATIGWVTVNQGSSADKLRLEIRERLWNLAFTSLPTLRPRVFRLLDKAHREARGEVEWDRPPEVKDDLVRVLALLQGSAPPTAVEAQLLREIWDWDLDYERDKHADIKAAAVACEEAYRSLPLASEVQDLFGEWHGDKVEKAHNDAAARLSHASTDEIANWVDQMAAALAVRPRNETYRLGSIAYRLGKLATPSARAYALKQVHDAPDKGVQFFAANRVVAGLRDAAREQGEESLRALHYDVAATAKEVSSQRLAEVLRQFHGTRHDGLNAADLALLEADLPVLRTDPVALVQVLAWLFGVDSARVERLVDATLTNTQGALAGRAVSAFMEELHLATRKTPITGEQAAWLASLLIHVEDIDDDMGTGASFHFGELLKGRPLTWAQFSSLIDRRLAHDEANAVPRRFPLDRIAPPPTGGDETEREAVLEKLLGALEAHPKAYFDLPEMIVKLDANTGALATVLERRVDSMHPATFDALEDVASFAGLMFLERPDARVDSLGTGPSDGRWRRIALAVSRAATGLVEREQHILFHRLTSQRSRAFWGGRVHDATVRLHQARAALDVEPSDDLKPLWRWRVDYLEKELARAREAEEERDR